MRCAVCEALSWHQRCRIGAVRPRVVHRWIRRLLRSHAFRRARLRDRRWERPIGASPAVCIGGRLLWNVVRQKTWLRMAVVVRLHRRLADGGRRLQDLRLRQRLWLPELHRSRIRRWSHRWRWRAWHGGRQRARLRRRIRGCAKRNRRRRTRFRWLGEMHWLQWNDFGWSIRAWWWLGWPAAHGWRSRHGPRWRRCWRCR